MHRPPDRRPGNPPPGPLQPILPPETPQDVGPTPTQQKLVVLASKEHIVADAATEKRLRIGTRKDAVTGHRPRSGDNNAAEPGPPNNDRNLLPARITSSLRALHILSFLFTSVIRSSPARASMTSLCLVPLSLSLPPVPINVGSSPEQSLRSPWKMVPLSGARSLHPSAQSPGALVVTDTDILYRFACFSCHRLSILPPSGYWGDAIRLSRSRARGCFRFAIGTARRPALVLDESAAFHVGVVVRIEREDDAPVYPERRSPKPREQLADRVHT